MGENSKQNESKNSLQNFVLPDIQSSRKATTDSTNPQKNSFRQSQNQRLQNNVQTTKQSDLDTLAKYEQFNQPVQQLKQENAQIQENQRSQNTPQYSTPSVPDQSLIQNKVQAYKFDNVNVIDSPDPKQNQTNNIHVDAVNDLTQPLLNKQEQNYAQNLGHSFNSKKVAVGPTFFNLRLICDCVGRALRRHIDYSQGTYWFLDQLQESKQLIKKLKKNKSFQNAAKMSHIENKDQNINIEESGSSEVTAFSYKFKDELKLTRIKNNNEEYYNEEELERSENVDDEQDELGSNSQFNKIKKALIQKSINQDLKDQSDIDDNSEQSIDEIDIEIQKQLDLKEQKLIEEIRFKEMMRQTQDKDTLNNISTLNKSLENYSSDEKQKIQEGQRQIKMEVTIKDKKNDKKNNKQLQNKSYVQLQLIEKDKKIKELTKMVQMYETGKIIGNKSPESIQEVMIIGQQYIKAASSFRSKNYDENDEDIIKKYEADMYKMTRAEFLMSQIDLDPIESHYSQEQQQLSSNIKYVRNNIISGIGSNNTRIQNNANIDENKVAQSAAQEEQNHATNGHENNATMLDGSFNSVSQGRSLNQSSGQNAQNIIQSGDLAEFIIENKDINNNSMKQKVKPAIISQENKGKNKDLQSVSKSSQNISNKKKLEQKSQLLYDQNSRLYGFSRQEQLIILQDQLKYFDERMQFDDEIYHEDIDVIEPSCEDIAAYCKYVTIASKMENESPIIAMVYIERILFKTGILINKYNWKRFLVICLCVASKVWDDDSLENIHFPKVMSDVSLLMINKLEQIFLDLFLNYDLIVKGSEYAKYYFIMRTLADEHRDECLTIEEKNALINESRKKKRRRDDWAEFPLMKPISAQQMQELQKNTAKAEIYLKDRHEKEIIFALGNKFKGIEQKARQRRYMLNNAEEINNVKYSEQEFNQKKPRYITSDQILSSTL